MSSDKTGIQWTDATWNPVTGCSKVSPGCAHCYAERVAIRLWPSQYPPIRDAWDDGTPRERPREFTDVQTHADRLDQPLRWKRPRKIFVNSMSDLFHEDVPDQFIVDVFGIMALAHWHTFQVLTKRPERMRSFLAAGDHGILRQFMLLQQNGGTSTRHVFRALDVKRRDGIEWRWPLPNVWLGVSVENQHFADERIPLLLQTPAAVRFISAEPLLGPVDIGRYVSNRYTLHLSADVEGMLLSRAFDGLTGDDGKPLTRAEAEVGLRALLAKGVKRIKMSDSCLGFNDQTGCPRHPEARLDWVIVGGESGAGARPFAEEWARSIVTQCRAAGVACFVKQLGANVFTVFVTNSDGVFIGGAGGRLRDRKGGDLAEWPEDLRRREFPEVSRA